MAISVYIVPLWKFFAGDLSHPLESIGIRPTVMRFGSRGWWIERKRRSQIRQREPLSRLKAKELAELVSADRGVPVSWHDEGSCVESTQFHCDDFVNHWWQWWTVRDKLSEYHMGGARETWKPNYLELRNAGADGAAKAEFGSVVHFTFSGTLAVPVDFSGFASIWPVTERWGTFSTRVYSIIAALRDVERSLDLLGARNFDWATYEPKKFGHAADGMTHLHQLLLKAQKHSLPLIFD